MLRYGVALCLLGAAVLTRPVAAKDVSCGPAAETPQAAAAEASQTQVPAARGHEWSTKLYRIHLEEPDGTDPAKLRSNCPKLPRTLYLRVERHKEWSPGNRRAWVLAVASTREDFGDRFLFRVIRLRIGVPARITASVREKTCEDATTCLGDSYFRGTTNREFVADWYVEAHDGKCLETWSASDRW
jgi:hypothetical protein